MNFLAHAYLSFGDRDILVGNMIADMVRGKQIELYPERVQLGIQIHRHIDRFTDIHPVNTRAMSFFRASARKYAGVFLDVSYDHFLALDEYHEPALGWKSFSQECYSKIASYDGLLPSGFSSMFKNMSSEDWLYNYRNRWLIKRSFRQLKRRAAYLSTWAPVFSAFERQYTQIEESYKDFFPDLVSYVKGLTSELR